MPGARSTRSGGNMALARPRATSRRPVWWLEGITSDVKRLKELEQENSCLKRMYADLSLENTATDLLHNLTAPRLCCKPPR